MADKDIRGELKACGWRFWENGMSMFSHAETSMELQRGEAGEWLLKDRKQRDTEGETVRTYRVDPEVPRLIAELADRVDMPSWEDLKEAESMYTVLDYSSATTMSLTYANANGEWPEELAYFINPKAARQHGFEKEVDEFYGLLKGCIKDDELISEEKTGPKPEVAAMLNGTWPAAGGSKDGDPGDGGEAGRKGEPVDNGNVCPECGCRNVTGKFCPECGCRMPER